MKTTFEELELQVMEVMENGNSYTVFKNIRNAVKKDKITGEEYEILSHMLEQMTY